MTNRGRSLKVKQSAFYPSDIGANPFASINEKEYTAWIQRQPSCISGQFSEWINGEGRCIAAHVRRVKWGSGIAHKPALAILPMTQREHLLQHQHGESFFHPPEWFEEKVFYYLHLYLKQRNMPVF